MYIHIRQSNPCKKDIMMYCRCCTCWWEVGPIRKEEFNGNSNLLQSLHGLDLPAKTVKHILAAAQKVRFQNHCHALTEVQAPCHLTADIPEEEVSDSLALS